MKKSSLFMFLINIVVIFESISAQSQGATAVNKFTQNLQPWVCEYGKNCVISAYSIFNTLGLVYAGAQGNTQSQIQNILNLNDFSMQEVHQIFKNTTDSVFAVSPEIDLFLANRFYADNIIEFLPQYLDTLQNFYDSDAINLDFQNNPENSRQEINLLVEKITKNLIQNLVPRGSITSDTISVLVNALYFKGTWMYPFDKYQTQNGIFWKNNNNNNKKFISDLKNIVRVPMMIQQGHKYFVGDIPNIQSSFIQLPYKGNDVSMYIIVSKNLQGTYANYRIESVLQNLNLSDIYNIFNQGYYSKVILGVPKFTVEFDVKLLDLLWNLGMMNVFYGWGANFGGMVDLEKNSWIYVSEGFHKVKISFDEAGTEAASAAAFGIAQTRSMSDTVEFFLDEPFGFYIVKEPEKVILFSGIINNPSDN